MANNYQRAKENGKSVKSYLSYSLGVGLPLTTAKFEHTFEDINQDGTSNGDKSIQRNPTVTGIHVNGNVYYPLAELNENSILAFNFGVAGYVLNYDVGEIRPTATKVYDYSLRSMQIGLPLCLDYKFGGEAVFNKSQKTSFTLGVGVTPIAYFNTFGDIGNVKAGVRPFLRAEVGFFAGIGWRITGSVLAGNAKTMDIPSDAAGMKIMPANSRITINSSPIYSIGISFMPFSFDWESFGW